MARPVRIPITREGKLGGPGYLKASASERHRRLDKCVGRYGYRSCLGSVQALEVLGKREFSAPERMKLAADRGYLKEKFGGPGSFSNPGHNPGNPQRGAPAATTVGAGRTAATKTRWGVETTLIRGNPGNPNNPMSPGMRTALWVGGGAVGLTALSLGGWWLMKKRKEAEEAEKAKKEKEEKEEKPTTPIPEIPKPEGIGVPFEPEVPAVEADEPEATQEEQPKAAAFSERIDEHGVAVTVLSGACDSLEILNLGTWMNWAQGLLTVINMRAWTSRQLMDYVYRWSFAPCGGELSTNADRITIDGRTYASLIAEGQSFLDAWLGLEIDLGTTPPERAFAGIMAGRGYVAVQVPAPAGFEPVPPEVPEPLPPIGPGGITF